MKKMCLPVSLLAGLCLLSPSLAPAQGVFGGSQNGLGSGGYLPSTATLPSVSHGSLTTTLTTGGYQFDILESSLGNIIGLEVDPTTPIIYPLLADRRTPNLPGTNYTPGFYATFTLQNNTPAPQTFTFPWNYWATNKIVFSIYDTNDVVVWTSVPLVLFEAKSDNTSTTAPQLLPFPLPSPVTLTLDRSRAWTQQVFVPLAPNGFIMTPNSIPGTPLPDGVYRLEASLSGTPSFTADAAFSVSNIQYGPIIDPLPLGPGPVIIPQNN